MVLVQNNNQMLKDYKNQSPTQVALARARATFFCLITRQESIKPSRDRQGTEMQPKFRSLTVAARISITYSAETYNSSLS